MNQYHFKPFNEDEIKMMQRIAFGFVVFFALLFVLAFAGCAEKEFVQTCDTANGEWTNEANTEIYLQFDDGILRSGAMWPCGIHIYETLDYSCCCDTIYLKSLDTGFEFWLTFWITSDSTAIMNGEHYAQPAYMKRI